LLMMSPLSQMWSACTGGHTSLNGFLSACSPEEHFYASASTLHQQRCLMAACCRCAGAASRSSLPAVAHHMTSLEMLEAWKCRKQQPQPPPSQQQQQQQQQQQHGSKAAEATKTSLLAIWQHINRLDAPPPVELCGSRHGAHDEWAGAGACVPGHPDAGQEADSPKVSTLGISITSKVCQVSLCNIVLPCRGHLVVSSTLVFSSDACWVCTDMIHISTLVGLTQREVTAPPQPHCCTPCLQQPRVFLPSFPFVVFNQLSCLTCIAPETAVYVLKRNCRGCVRFTAHIAFQAPKPCICIGNKTSYKLIIIASAHE
jgi:hypothetical protein